MSNIFDMLQDIGPRPNRIPAEIWIGGLVPRRLISELCAKITGERLALDWGMATFVPTHESHLCDACAKYEGAFYLCDVSATRWCFPELEAFLRTNNIAFDRRNPPYGEHYGEMVQFRPPDWYRSWPMTADGERLVRLSALSHVEGKLCSLVVDEKGVMMTGLVPLDTVRIAGILAYIEQRTSLLPALEDFKFHD